MVVVTRMRNVLTMMGHSDASVIQGKCFHWTIIQNFLKLDLFPIDSKVMVTIAKTLTNARTTPAYVKTANA